MGGLKRTGSSPEKWRFTLVIVKDANPKLCDWLWNLPVGAATMEITSRLETSLSDQPDPVTAIERPSGRKGVTGGRGGGKRRAPKARHSKARSPTILATGRVERADASQPSNPDLVLSTAFSPPSLSPGVRAGSAATLLTGALDPALDQDQPDAETLAFLRSMDAVG